MTHPVRLVGLILGIPLAGVLVAFAIQMTVSGELTSAVQRAFPDAPLAQAAAKFGAVCREPNIRLQKPCASYQGSRIVGITSVAAAAIGLLLVGVIRLAGAAAGKDRRLLLVVFRPGLYVTALVLIALVLINAAVILEVGYFGLGRLPLQVAGPIVFGAVGGALAIARHAFGLIQPVSPAVIGLPVPESEAERLWGRVRDVARSLDTLPPDHIVAGLDPNFFVTETEVRHAGGVCSGRTLYCSLPLMRILSEQEFIGIVGHELAHFKGQDTRFSQDFFPIYRGAATSIVALHLQGNDGWRKVTLVPAVALFGYFLECFALAERKLSRDRELVADRAGAAVTSVEAMGAELVKVHAFASAWTLVHDAWVQLLQQRREWINASTTYADTVVKIAARDELKGIESGEMAHPTDSHPPLDMRLDGLAVSLDDLRPHAVRVAPADAAAGLFDAPDDLERAVTAVYQRTLLQYLEVQSAHAAT